MRTVDDKKIIVDFALFFSRFFYPNHFVHLNYNNLVILDAPYWSRTNYLLLILKNVIVP